MTTQLEAFPRTAIDVLEELSVLYAAALEKARNALDALSDDEKIARAYEKAEDRVHEAQRLLKDITTALSDLRPPATGKISVLAEVAEIVNGGALDSDGILVTAEVTPGSFTDEVAAELDAAGIEYNRDQAPPTAVDPITGEVEAQREMTSKEFLAARDAKAQKDAAARDVEPATSLVVVLYPDDDEPHVTEVGPATRYAELVADYYTFLGATGVHDDVGDFQVLAEDELTWNGGGGRNLTAPIQERDYGHRLIVASADQGSVTGAVGVTG
jgi:hypothetical protein